MQMRAREGRILPDYYDVLAEARRMVVKLEEGGGGYFLRPARVYKRGAIFHFAVLQRQFETWDPVWFDSC